MVQITQLLDMGYMIGSLLDQEHHGVYDVIQPDDCRNTSTGYDMDTLLLANRLN